MIRTLTIALLIGLSGSGSTWAQSYVYTPSCCTTPSYPSTPAYNNSAPSYPHTPVSATAPVSPPTPKVGQVSQLPQTTTIYAQTYSPPAYTGPSFSYPSY